MAAPPKSCAICNGSDTVPGLRHLLTCQKCAVSYHDKCHIPPVSFEQLIHLLEEYNKDKHAKFIKWSCDHCAKGKRKALVYHITDSDDAALSTTSSRPIKRSRILPPSPQPREQIVISSDSEEDDNSHKPITKPRALSSQSSLPTRSIDTKPYVETTSRPAEVLSCSTWSQPKARGVALAAKTLQQPCQLRIDKSSSLPKPLRHPSSSFTSATPIQTPRIVQNPHFTIVPETPQTPPNPAPRPNGLSPQADMAMDIDVDIPDHLRSTSPNVPPRDIPEIWPVWQRRYFTVATPAEGMRRPRKRPMAFRPGAPRDFEEPFMVLPC